MCYVTYVIYFCCFCQGHGIQAGTDTSQPWAQAMYSMTLIITLLLAGGRMLLRVQTRARSGSQTRPVGEEAVPTAGARRN